MGKLKGGNQFFLFRQGGEPTLNDIMELSNIQSQISSPGYVKEINSIPKKIIDMFQNGGNTLVPGVSTDMQSMFHRNSSIT